MRNENARMIRRVDLKSGKGSGSGAHHARGRVAIWSVFLRTSPYAIPGLNIVIELHFEMSGRKDMVVEEGV